MIVTQLKCTDVLVVSIENGFISAFRFPFILGFGEDLIEIRLVVNGNLLASMYMPSVRLLSLKVRPGCGEVTHLQRLLKMERY